jgi:hypothetical protein
VLALQKPLSLFTKLSPSRTGINFTNLVREDDSLHIMKYEYLYNGHGVGIGDFNGDGLPDVFISGNAVPSKLYLNKGGMKFEDITKSAGITAKGKWSTGVSIADVNGDGLPDIYVSHSGLYTDPAMLSNELHINQGVTNGIPRFKEMARDFGLDAPGTQSTQALFVDYDLDGDLDMFLLNHSNHTYNPFLNTRKTRSEPNMKFGNRLFRNDRVGENMSFTDVTLKAGIVNNGLNFGLSVNASDLNGDGYPDIYTTSDYTEKDCMYINNRDGTFSESIEKSVAYMSKYSMGCDIADFNNDGRFDIMTLDMLPADNYRQKLLKGPDEYDQYHLLADSGYYYQQMRNMLQLNQGQDASGVTRFSEIGQLAGVSNTDWSWSALFADFDNDGWKDLFVSNGYLRDFTNMDFLKYTVADAQLEQAKKGNFNFKTFDLVKKMPSNKLRSYGFRNKGDLTFEDKSLSWGLDDEAVSNGAAYADLDNDGDLDLIVCRNNDPVAVYQNNTSGTSGAAYIKLMLKGAKQNTAAIGAKVKVYAKGLIQVQELYPVRGYQSSVATELHFGLGNVTVVDSVVVQWTDGSSSAVVSPPVNQVINFDQVANQNRKPVAPETVSGLFIDVTTASGVDFIHKENPFVDFKNEVLLPYQPSRTGPALASGDVNGDGLDDVFFGGAIDQASVLYLQQKNGSFKRSLSQPWVTEIACEDVNALFIDLDNDGDKDLYVVSGGNEYDLNSPEYADRIYVNDGMGNFKIAAGLPLMLTSKRAIAAGDIDNDGDMDLFIGGQSVPGSFPQAARSYILRNDSQNGRLVFTDITAENAFELLSPGIINDAVWADLDRDGFPELMIAGEWMPLQLYKNLKGRLTNSGAGSGLAGTGGLWCSIIAEDLDGDGDLDFVAGNAGLNTQFKASPTEPMEMLAGDFDGNGTVDPLISYYIDGKPELIASRDELFEQMPGLKRKFLSYKDYAAGNLSNVVSKSQAEKATKYTITTLSSAIIYNNGGMKFDVVPLSPVAQFSMVNKVLIGDFNSDNKKDILVAGNYYPYRVQFGRSAASPGTLLAGSGSRHYDAVEAGKVNLFATGDVRKMISMATTDGKLIILAKNDGPAQVYRIK